VRVEFFDPEIGDVVTQAFGEAISMGHAAVLPGHLLCALVAQPSGSSLETAFRNVGITLSAARDAIASVPFELGEPDDTVTLTPSSQFLVGVSVGLARARGRKAGASDLAVAFVAADALRGALAERLGASTADLAAELVAAGLDVPSQPTGDNRD
jgi:hypothetical protein